MAERNDKQDSGELRKIFQHLNYFFHLRLAEMGTMAREAVEEWSSDNCPHLAASLAFYTLLSLAPLLLVIVAIVGLAYGRKAAEGELVAQLQNVIGRQEALTLQGLVLNAYRPGAGLIASALGLLTLVWGASSAVVDLRDSLNKIWRVAQPTGGSRLAAVALVLKERFYDFAMILGVGFLLLVLLILNAGIAAVGAHLGPALPVPELLIHLLNALISFVVIAVVFAAIYKTLPDVPLTWSDVIIGALVTSLLFGVGKFLIALYLGKATFRSTYGAAGSLVLVLVWIYYSAQLFLLGAEFTKVVTKYCGSRAVLDDRRPG